ncbi:MAG: DUF2322 family protein [Thioalkalivibrionaceae bacterium]
MKHKHEDVDPFALPETADLARLELYADGIEPVAVIENVDGSKLSAAIYFRIAVDFGGINAKAAARGLELFEHHAPEAVVEARQTVGRHPNIDRLITLAAGDDYWSVRARRQ